MNNNNDMGGVVHSAPAAMRRRDVLSIGVLLAGTVLAMLNQTALNPALPVIMQSLHVDAVTVQWLVSAYSLINAMVIPLSAYLMGRFGVRRLFCGAIMLFAVGSFIGAMSSSFPLVLLGRALQAICAGVNLPMMLSVILLLVPKQRRGSAMGVVTLAMCFAPAVGPTVSGVLADAFGWQGLFWFVGIVAVVVLLGAAFALHVDTAFKRIRFDAPSFLSSSAGLALLLYGISSCASSGDVWSPVVCIVLGVVFLAVFVRRQLSMETPLLDLRMLFYRDYRVMCIVAALMMGSLISLNVVMPLYVQNVRMRSALVSGLIMLPGALIGGGASVLAGRLFDRWGVRRCAVPGILVVFAGALSLLALGMHTPVWAIAAIYMVLPIGLQFTQTPLNTWGLNSLDNRVIQHGNALMNTANQIVTSIMTAVLVSAVAFGSGRATGDAAQRELCGVHTAFMVLCLVAGVATVVVVAFVRDRGRERTAGMIRETIVDDVESETVSEKAA